MENSSYFVICNEIVDILKLNKYLLVLIMYGIVGLCTQHFDPSVEVAHSLKALQAATDDFPWRRPLDTSHHIVP